MYVMLSSNKERETLMCRVDRLTEQLGADGVLSRGMSSCGSPYDFKKGLLLENVR